MSTFGTALRASLFWLIAGVVAPVLPLLAAAARLPELPAALLQPGSEPIELTIAGVPAVLQRVSSEQPPHAVLTAVEGLWRQAGNKVRRDDDGGWQSVSRVDGQRIEAVQLRAGAGPEQGSEGYLIRWRLEKVRAAAGAKRDSLAHRLLPPVAVSLFDTASDEQSPTRGRTIVAWVPAAVDAVERLLESRAASLGLRRRRDFEPAEASASVPGGERVQFYVASNAHLAVTLHTEGSGTALVLHLMETTR